MTMTLAELASPGAAERSWSEAVDAFVSTFSPGSHRRTVASVLRRFESGVSCGPWEVRSVEVEEWFGRQGFAARTADAYRSHLRRFYRWAQDEGHVLINPVAIVPNRLWHQIPASWAAILDEFDASLGDGAHDRATYGCVRRFAEEIGPAPAEVTAEQIDEWLDGHDVSAKSRSAYRSYLRRFFTWATDRGYVAADPVVSAGPLGYALDAEWVEAFEAFEADEMRRRVGPATLQRRRGHLTRFAVFADEMPFAVDRRLIRDWLSVAHVAGAASTVQAMQESVRAFYRWAQLSGRVVDDPACAEEPRGRAKPIPQAWASAIDEWQLWMRASGAAETTIRTRASHLEAFARSHAESSPFEVTAADLVTWITRGKLARETLRSQRMTWRSFYGWAVDSGHMTINPANRLPRVRAADPNVRPATPAEFAEALASTNDPRWRLALRLAYDAGLRRAEVAGLRLSDLFQIDGAWSIRVTGKGAKLRVIPITTSLASTICAVANGEEYVFPGDRDGHLSPEYVGRRIRDLLPDGVRMHMLRHAFATRAYNHSSDVLGVQQLLGHASAATTQRYVQIADARLRALMEAVTSDER